MRVAIQRVYDPPDPGGGLRVLVDRLWPRGVARGAFPYDHWRKDAAPSADLRIWFGHDPARWSEFRRRYHAELDTRPEEIAQLRAWAREPGLTLLTAARIDREHHAAALQEYLLSGIAAPASSVWIALLGAVNVGGTGKLPMARLRELCEGALGLKRVRTYLQSGNLVFESEDSDADLLARRIEEAVEAHFGFRPPVLLRSAREMRAVRDHAFLARWTEGAKTVVLFLESAPDLTARARALGLAAGFPEVVEMDGREMYLYFPEGQGRTKLPMAKIAKALGVRGTARNRNTVGSLVEMAEDAAGAGS